MPRTTSARAESHAVVQGAAKSIYTWPRSGVWSTVLIETPIRSLICYMAVGSISPPGRTIAGLRRKGDETAIEIATRHTRTPFASNVVLLIDGVAAGTFPIRRVISGFKYRTIVAPIKAGAWPALQKVMLQGTTIAFVSGRVRYVAPLEHADQAFATLDECSEAANHLVPLSRPALKEDVDVT